MSDMVERVARQYPLTDEQGLRELHLLYNHAEDDSRQFTRWQMLAAINHGIRMVIEAKAAIASMQADTDLERIKQERDQAVEALKTADAWLDRWARHIGDCPGIDGCECGLTRARYEAETTIASIEGAGHD